MKIPVLYFPNDNHLVSTFLIKDIYQQTLIAIKIKDVLQVYISGSLRVCMCFLLFCNRYCVKITWYPLTVKCQCITGRNRRRERLPQKPIYMPYSDPQCLPCFLTQSVVTLLLAQLHFYTKINHFMLKTRLFKLLGQNCNEMAIVLYKLWALNVHYFFIFLFFYRKQRKITERKFYTLSEKTF